MRRFVGRTAFVTGAGSGIGRATAQRLIREGVTAIVLVDVRSDRLEEVARELSRGSTTSVMPMEQDLADGDATAACVRAAAVALGGLDIVVSNAGISWNGPFVEHPRDQWDRVLAVNLTASFVIGQTAAKEMIRIGRGGVILFTASSVERGGAAGTATAYGVSKMGVIQLARGMAVALAPHRIRVNCVSPGWTDTRIGPETLGEETYNRIKEQAAERLPAGRVARPDKIAAVFAFLASDDASYVSGANYWADGGGMGLG